MDKLVIFSTPLTITLMLVIIALHMGTAVLRRVTAGSEKRSIGYIAVSATALNLAVHLFLFAMLIYLKTSPDELLFILVISSALALTSTNVGREEK